MSLFAGVYSLNGQVEIDEKCKSTIMESISRHDDFVDTYTDKRFFLAKVDVGAYHDPAFLKESVGIVSVMAGDPILSPPKNHGRSRSSDLSNISLKLTKGDISILKNCQGSFTLGWYNPSSDELILATDKAGIRPIYYYKDSGMFYFSSCMRVLEALEKVLKRMDLIAITEGLILGCPLGSRTAYADIHVLKGGEYIKISEPDIKISHYFRWDDISVSKADMNGLLDHLYQCFMTAVGSRGWRDTETISFLSGGLDSRCVVTALWQLGKSISTINLSPHGSEDEVYAEQYANALDLKYKYVQRSHHVRYNEKYCWHNMMSECIPAMEFHNGKRPGFPQLVFSGDGGSVGLGHVYMNEEYVNLMRKGSIDEVVAYYMKNKILPARLIKKDVYSRLKSALYDDVKTELSSINCGDPGRNFYIFLIDNEQRHHLKKFYEDIDIHRLEYQLPFYDGLFLEAIVSTPVDYCLRHEFYSKWLNLFPVEFMSVPWQTYPGHVPCPVKKDRTYRYQWDEDKRDSFAQNWIWYDNCKRIISRSDFAKILLKRRYLLAALGLHRVKFKDFTSEFLLSTTYQNYYSKCDGNIAPL